MNSSNSKVSIIMGIYNCEDTLAESIESVVNQTYDNWELIMCDDCSVDKTYDIAQKYQKMYPNKIKVIKNERNITLGPTLNKCLKYANGNYIARHDGDDLYKKNKLEKQVKFLNENRQYDLVGTGMNVFDENGFYGTRIPKERPVPKDLMKGSTFAHATIMARDYVYRELNGYSEKDNRRGVEDYDLWFRFFKKGYIGYNLQEALYDVREDRGAYKRKNIKRRFNEIKTMLSGRALLGLDLKYSLYIIKPIITIITPKFLLRMYAERKMNQVNK